MRSEGLRSLLLRECVRGDGGWTGDVKLFADGNDVSMSVGGPRLGRRRSYGGAGECDGDDAVE